MKKLTGNWYFTYTFAVTTICFFILIIVMKIDFYPSDSDIFKADGKANFEIFESSIDPISSYDVGDIIQIANSNNVKENHKYINGLPLIPGDVYIIHNASSSEASIKTREKINNNLISKCFSSDKITKIKINSDNIQYLGNELKCEKHGGGIYGFYYSFDGNPKMVGFLPIGTLLKQGDVWQYQTDDYNLNHFYITQKIKENLYCYEGNIIN